MMTYAGKSLQNGTMNSYAITGLGILLAAGVAYAAFLYARPAVAPDVPSDGDVPPPSVVVHMMDSGYSTSSIRVRAGQSVAFINDASDARWPASDLHPTHEIYSQFDPRRPIEPGGQWAFRFDRCGQWRFHDHLKPNVRGVIVVSCPQ